MEVLYDDNLGGIILKPETQFEETWLKSQFKKSKNDSFLTSFKTGVSAADFVGVRIHKVGGFANG